MSFKLAPAQPSLPFDQTVNQETVSRYIATGGVQAISGQMRFGFFKPSRSGIYTQVATSTTGTAAAATPTLCRMGVWIVNPDGSLTLIGSTPNDTSLFAAANTSYQRSLSASVTFQAGKIYAFSLLVVTAATAPTIVTPSFPFWTAPFTPQIAIILTGQNDLPANVPPNSNTTGGASFGVFLP